MAAQVRILWDESAQAFRVSTPYKPQFVDTLKTLIPSGERAWDRDNKIWTVVEKYGVPVKGLCEQVWGASNVMYVDRAAMAQQQAAARHAQQAQAQQANYQYVAPPVKGDPLDTVMATFVKMLPFEVAKKAFHGAAMAHHPDKNGGDGSKMNTLNVAWDRLRSEFWRQP